MSTFSDVRKIDNSRVWLPLATSLLIIFLIVVFIWFFRGGSFRLYASVFFGLYYLTGQIWVSVLLIGIIQNIVFLPLRFIGMKLSTSMKAFEDQLDMVKNQDEQYILFQQKVKKGDFGITFYIFNFIINAIAFFSAGRIFLIDFYSQPLDKNLIYHFIPYPDYPLQGTYFNFPFFKINSTIAVDWRYIIYFWLGLSLFFAILQLLWRVLKIFLSKNQSLLRFRIGYNRILIAVGGVGLTLFVLSTLLLRNFPTSFSPWWLVADLTKQNSTMNLITAVGTFLTVVIAGIKSVQISSKNLLNAGVEQISVEKIAREKMRQSIGNGLILGIGAYTITSQIPSAFELSVAMFEVLYILSPLTFDRFLVSHEKPVEVVPNEPKS